MMKLSKKYGDIYSLKMGCHTAVVVNGVNAIKECLVKKGTDFADRPYSWIVELDNPRYEVSFHVITASLSPGITDAHFDEKWQRRRQFAHTTLRSFGFGKTSMESKICEDISFLLDEFRDIQDKSIDTGAILNRSISNVICSIMFRKRFNYSDPKFSFIIDTIGKLFELMGTMCELGFLPFRRPLNQSIINNYNTLGDDLRKFCKQQIDEHREVFDPDNIGDFIDAYLAETMKQDGNKDLTDD
ncbi:cytochrome P450 2U1-like [Saccoglossus kowalevskii]|uniref:Cytochrome P450 2U1-like n=1 Tax=Saccoglossus kowalevskii TaxID=10224 RepID=A0ABM0M7Y4_SACKO|nr:PREDICTED: cytochrome P450 2U1-like [Saccoglossus kowalevskii]